MGWSVMGTRQPGLILFFFVLAIWACACGLGKADPGTFEVVFDWADPAPADGTALYVYAKIDKRDQGAATGKQIAESSVLKYSPGVKLDFAEVPYGDAYVVVVELKEQESKTARARYFGESE